MSHYKYLVIGGGTTVDAAVRAFRKSDPNGSIGLISVEPGPFRPKDLKGRLPLLS